MTLIETAEALDALPLHTVLRAAPSGAVWEVTEEVTDGTEIRYRSVWGDELFMSKAMALRGPFRVLYIPGSGPVGEPTPEGDRG